MAYQFNKATILIVDDMAPMLSLMRSVLSVFGFKDILLASNGEDAYRLFQQHNPDLIITDWVMAPMSGIELTKKIRKDKKSSNPFVPIIMMTGFASQKRVEQARDAGVTEFLVKPFVSRDLYLRIAQIIEKPRRFVAAEDFFGPDRRRRIVQNKNFTRRDEDVSVTEEANSILKQLRKEAQSIAPLEEED